MRARIKTFLAPLSAVAFWAVAGGAFAGCVTNCLPPPAPPIPTLPPGGGCGSGCGPVSPPYGGGGGGSVNVNVNINNAHASANANASANASATGGAGGGIDPREGGYIGGNGGNGGNGGRGRNGGTTVIVAGGGGAYFNVDQPYPMTAQGLAVEGARSERVSVPYTSTRSWEKRYRIQAVCLDDRNVPHPASQVRPGKDISDGYEDELYRCMAGTKMQWTRTDLDGGEGQTVTCNKNEALWYGGKVLECRPQKRERDCHERSLLRRYGAGVKEVVLRGEETITEYREEVVEHSFSSSGSMMMDGGVGGRVF
nr:hypothetical protein [Brevundimonas terrae]